jgi:predicted MFS family arabinose efflux permease
MGMGSDTSSDVRIEPAIGLWRRPEFVKLWVGKTVSTFGSHISGTAIPLAALLVLGATPAEMGILTALGAAPVLLVGLLAGVWVDRLPRRPILIAADMGRAALLLTIPLAFILHRLAFGQLYAVVFLSGILTVFADVGAQAFLPSVVPPEQLVEGNGNLATGDSVAEIGGPSLAGFLVQWISAPFAIVFDALSFLVSAASLQMIRAPIKVRSEDEPRESMWREAAQGLRLILGHPVLRALTLSLGIFEFFGYFIGTLYALFAIRTLHLPPAAVGTLVGLGGISALAGSLVAERVVRRLGIGRVLIGSLMTYGLLGALMPLAGGPPWVAYACMAAPQLLGDAFIAVHFIAQTSLRQSLIPDRLLGRATASMHVLERGVGPLGALIAGLLATFTSPRLTIAIGVAGVVAAGGSLLFSPVRMLRDVARPQE